MIGDGDTAISITSEDSPKRASILTGSDRHSGIPTSTDTLIGNEIAGTPDFGYSMRVEVVEQKRRVLKTAFPAFEYFLPLSLTTGRYKQLAGHASSERPDKWNDVVEDK